MSMVSVVAAHEVRPRFSRSSRSANVVDEARLPHTDGGAERRPGLDSAQAVSSSRDRRPRRSRPRARRTRGPAGYPARVARRLRSPAATRSRASKRAAGNPAAILPLVGGEIGVSRRKREAVRLPDDLADLDSNREIQVARHPPDHGDLLQVLPSEKRGVGLDLEEELRDDGRHAAKVAGSRGALPSFRDAGDLDGSREPRRVELARLRAGRARPRLRASSRAASSCSRLG